MRRKLLYLYLALLVLSHAVAWWRGPLPEGLSGDSLLHLQTEALGEFALNYQDLPADDISAPALLLLHGSPGSGHHLDKLAAAFDGKFRILIPDMPGFGGSTRRLPNYSIHSHAQAVGVWLKELGVDRAHVIAFSMGGGVALHLQKMQPQLVSSLTLLSAIGVQELELLGSYEINHAIHALQLFAIRSAQWLLPHFGSFTRSAAIPYARNFFDSDQRPLRDLLLQLDIPTLILHGEKDFLVHPAAAREHHRIVPQSKLQIYDASHFLPWTRQQEVATAVTEFIGAVETQATTDGLPLPPTGVARNRAEADPSRIIAATQPWDPTDAPPLKGAPLLLAMLLLAMATFVSEDLTCIATGLLVAQARIGFIPGVIACFMGILIGDGLLFLAGRWLGKPALTRFPMRMMVSPAAVNRARRWFQSRGSRVILLSRFMPGMRLPTYVAAGVLGMKFRVFIGYFALAGVIWTPALVGISTWAGREAFALLDTLQAYALPTFVGLMLGMLALQKLVVPLFSHRGRRLLYGSTRRKFEWEFWPSWLIYLPLTFYILYLAIRYRGLRTVTACNPGIFTSGLVGEPKWEILQCLAHGAADENEPEMATSEFLPATLYLAATPAAEDRMTSALDFIHRHSLAWPVVLKPNRGERGRGVEIIQNVEQLQNRLRNDTTELLLQQQVQGIEFGIFYVREPGQKKGQIISINGKNFPRLLGDGKRTLEQLILDDDRAVRMAGVHFDYHSDRLYDVPTANEIIALVEVGAHSRGTLFTDRRDLQSPALLQRLDQFADGYPGFHFGRFDIIAASADDLSLGCNFKILELNGLTSEAAHIYDPKFGVCHAWRTLAAQWHSAYRIGRSNLDSGHKRSSWKDLWRGLRLR